MSKEWILNTTMNRFQLNFKRNVGATSYEIRKCSPKKVVEWEEYYYKNVRAKEHIIELGKKLFIKISEIVKYEVDSITEKDCIDYMINLVINRTFDGYKNEINTIYGIIEKEIGIKPEPAPDEWDRIYNVDFYIKVKDKYIGIQIKPVDKNIQISQIFKEKELQKRSHEKFKKNFVGNVYYVFSETRNGKKYIQNIEVLQEIKAEIIRLQNL